MIGSACGHDRRTIKPVAHVTTAAWHSFRQRLNSHREIPGAVHGVSYANRASISIRKGRSSAFAPVCRAPLSVCARSTLPQPQCWRARVQHQKRLLA